MTCDDCAPPGTIYHNFMAGALFGYGFSLAIGEDGSHAITISLAGRIVGVFVVPVEKMPPTAEVSR